MFKHEIGKIREAGFIKSVVVARLFFEYEQTAAKESATGYVREGKNFKYLLVFIPNKDKLPRDLVGDIVASPWIYFIFLKRAEEPDEIRWYRQLFAVSKDISDWGFKSFEVIDLTSNLYLEDAFKQLKDHLKPKKVSLYPIRKFIAKLVDRERENAKKQTKIKTSGKLVRDRKS